MNHEHIIDAPATGRQRPLITPSLTDGTTSQLVPTECNNRRPGMSAMRSNCCRHIEAVIDSAL